jgi:single-strand DNA-binding protein
MNDINCVTIIGRLTKDVELKTTSSGSYVARLSIANNQSKKVNNEWINNASFFTAIAWEKSAQNCAQYLHKGSKVAIHGKLDQRSWEDNAGVRHYAVEIIAQSVQFLDPKPDSQNDYQSYQQSAPKQSAQQTNYGQNEFGQDMSDDDLPF